MKLIIIRHGLTHSNAGYVIQGDLDSLNAKGLSQAKSVARKLKGEEIDVIFSSDMRRARQTAREIAKYHDVPVYYARDIRERHAGALRGKPLELMLDEMRRSGMPEHKYAPKGGESIAQVQARTVRFLRRIYGRYKNKTVLLVTHGHVIRGIASFYLGLSLERLMRVPVKNTGVMVIHIDGRSARKVKDEMFVWESGSAQVASKQPGHHPAPGGKHRVPGIKHRA